MYKKNTIKDGRMKHPLYDTWMGMKLRCYTKTNPKYYRYGGRGIAMCDKWLNDFWTFAEDMGSRPEGHTLDRIDVNGNYEPANCRWADKYTQARNTSRKLTGYIYDSRKHRPDNKLSKPWRAQVTIKGKLYVKMFKTKKESRVWINQIIAQVSENN